VKALRFEVFRGGLKVGVGTMGIEMVENVVIILHRHRKVVWKRQLLLLVFTYLYRQVLFILTFYFILYYIPIPLLL